MGYPQTPREGQIMRAARFQRQAKKPGLVPFQRNVFERQAALLIARFNITDAEIEAAGDGKPKGPQEGRIVRDRKNAVE